MSEIEVLVTTMNAEDFSIYSKMNLQTDAIIANQANYFDYKECQIDGHLVKMITTNTKGSSINRNIAISHSKAPIIIFADDDQVFVDGYEKIVQDLFEDNPRYEAIKFCCNIVELSLERYEITQHIKKMRKARVSNCMSGGIHALAIYRDILIKKNLLFPIGIGPGTSIFCGEDSIFLNEMLKKKVNFYLSPITIAYMEQTQSSWFQGYDEKYFFAVGYIYASLYQKFAILFAFRKAILFRKNKLCIYSFRKLMQWLRKGISEYYDGSNISYF